MIDWGFWGSIAYLTLGLMVGGALGIVTAIAIQRFQGWIGRRHNP